MREKVWNTKREKEKELFFKLSNHTKPSLPWSVVGRFYTTPCLITVKNRMYFVIKLPKYTVIDPLRKGVKAFRAIPQTLPPPPPSEESIFARILFKGRHRY